jgi:hypothetical protein
MLSRAPLHQARGRGTHVHTEQQRTKREVATNPRQQTPRRVGKRRRSPGADQPPEPGDEHPSLGRRATAHREWQLLGATGDK